tara:strand:+ start:69 stop:566 length:498 start_codon:yes stop_codon:yes gene_type:complete
MTEVRNQFKSQDLATLEASSINTVGGRIFPDNAAVPNLRALIEVVDSWRATHAVAYGGPIGGTDAVVTHQMQTDSVEAIYTPTGKQVAQVVAVQVANGGGAPMTADLLIGGVVVTSGLTINPSESGGFDIDTTLLVGPSTPLQVHLTSGSASDAVAKAAYVLVGV